MNYRIKTLLARKSYTADGVETINIDAATPISKIVISYAAVSVISVDADGHPVRCIPKVELVDGSDVLESLDGAETHALDWYHNQKEPVTRMSYLTSHETIAVMNLNFGRYLWDPWLAFDPRRYTNPQLKITVDVNGGGADSVQGYLTVSAFMFDEKEIMPIGFLMAKEIKSYAPGVSTHEYTDMPTDHPYRKLLIRAQKYETHPNAMLSQIKLASDEDAKVILDQTIADVLYGITSLGRPYREVIYVPADTTERNFFCTPGQWPVFTLAQWRTTPFAYHLSIFEGGGGRFEIKSGAAGPNVQIHCQGWCPHSAIEIPFGLQNDIEDWFDVTKVGSLKLDITSGASAAATDTVQIFLQQFRRY